MVGRLKAFLLCLVLVFGILPSEVFAGEAGCVGAGCIYVSRISADDANEYVELYNASDEDVDVAGMRLQYNNLQLAAAEYGEGVFAAKSYFTVVPEKAASIPQNGLMVLTVGEVETAFCWGSKSWGDKGCDVRASTANLGAGVMLEACFEGDWQVACGGDSSKMFVEVKNGARRTGGFVLSEVDEPMGDGGDGDSDDEDDEVEPVVRSGDQMSLKISKVQTGYGEDARMEYVEIYNSSSEAVDAAGLRIEYLSSTHDGGEKPTRVLREFEGEIGRLVLKPFGYYVVFSADYPEEYVSGMGSYFDVNYSGKSGQMAANGSVRVVSYDGKKVDLVGWGTAKQFETRATVVQSGQSFVRCVDGETKVMVDSDNNFADFYDGSGTGPYGVVNCAVYDEEEGELNLCVGLELSEIGANIAEQFIEVHNATDGVLDVTGCRLMTNRNSKYYVFGDLELGADEYLAVMIKGSGLTLTKTTTGTVYLMSEGGGDVEHVEYNGLKAGSSWAKFGEGWRQTYAVTVEAVNEFLEYLPCSAGYERNLETGRCRKIAVVTVLADCGEGKYRNPETGRCKKYDLPAVQAPCRDGYYRSLETNRCRKIALATAGLSPCQDGYERNPETNRCRKIRENSGADFGVIPTSVDDRASFVGWAALGVVAGGGVLVISLQFRQEIGRAIKKVFAKQTASK